MLRYLYNVLLAVDQLGNALLGGSPRETICHRLGRYAATRNVRCPLCREMARRFCWALDMIDPGHCDR